MIFSKWRPLGGATLGARQKSKQYAIGLYRDVWIAAIASSRRSPATQTAAICVRFQGRRVRHVYVTMHVTFLTHKSALIYRRGLRQRVASLTLDCNGVFAIRAYCGHRCQFSRVWKKFNQTAFKYIALSSNFRFWVKCRCLIKVLVWVKCVSCLVFCLYLVCVRACMRACARVCSRAA